jgi:predicted RNase H-like HicB family nuclease
MCQGKTEKELKENILDALNLYLSDMREEYITDKKSFIKEEPLVCI